MTKKNLDWKPDETLPAGKGATKQRFVTNDGSQDLAIETIPWGDGDLTATELCAFSTEIFLVESCCPTQTANWLLY